MTYYLIVEDWSYDGAGGSTPHLYTTWEKAIKIFNDLIAKDKEEGISSDSFKSNDVEHENDEDDAYNYTVETSSNGNVRVWSWYEKGNYCETHSDYSLFPIVADEDFKSY